MLPKIGQTIELLDMPNDPDPIPVGTKGVVDYVGPMILGEVQIGVEWENGRGIMLIYPIDSFRVVE